MPIHILQPNESLRVDLYGTIFHYKHLTADQIRNLKAANPLQGDYTIALLKESLVKWEGDISDGHGNFIEYTPELVPLLSEISQNSLRNVIESGLNFDPDKAKKEEAELKN